MKPACSTEMGLALCLNVSHDFARFKVRILSMVLALYRQGIVPKQHFFGVHTNGIRFCHPFFFEVSLDF